MSEETYLAAVRLRIRKARQATQMLQEEVAEKVDLTHRHYQRYEAITHPKFAVSLLTLRRIAQALAVPISELTREANEDELKELGLEDTRF